MRLINFLNKFLKFLNWRTRNPKEFFLKEFKDFILIIKSNIDSKKSFKLALVEGLVLIDKKLLNLKNVQEKNLLLAFAREIYIVYLDS